MIAQELMSPSKESRKWAAIYNVARASANSKGRVDTRHPFPLEMDQFKYCLFIFEIDNDVISSAAEDGIDIGQVKGLFVKGVDSKEEIFDVLSEQEIFAGKFCPPWRCEFPV